METKKNSRIQRLNASSVRGLCLYDWLLIRYLARIEGGTLKLSLASGAEYLLGDSTAVGAEVDLQIINKTMCKRLIFGGSMALGEGYVKGFWQTSDLSALLTLLAGNQKKVGKLRKGLSFIKQWGATLHHKGNANTLSQSKVNIEAHYDLSNDFYKLFLDPTMTYSSARFKSKEESLEVGQENKIQSILDYAECSAGSEVLEIGTGWGALALRAARRGYVVTTLTLSNEQLSYANELIDREGVSESVALKLQDYREETGKYDAVVSCEMIEAVGREYLPSYFAKIRDSLRVGGKAVIQAITISDDRYEEYCRSCDWIQKYIFPGGHLPSQGAISNLVKATGGLKIQTVDSFALDYAETLRRWRDAFNDQVEALERLEFDSIFQRKWNYYLSYCEAGFEAGTIDVSQIVIERT